MQSSNLSFITNSIYNRAQPLLISAGHLKDSCVTHYLPACKQRLSVMINLVMTKILNTQTNLSPYLSKVTNTFWSKENRALTLIGAGTLGAISTLAIVGIAFTLKIWLFPKKPDQEKLRLQELPNTTSEKVTHLQQECNSLRKTLEINENAQKELVEANLCIADQAELLANTKAQLAAVQQVVAATEQLVTLSQRLEKPLEKKTPQQEKREEYESYCKNMKNYLQELDQSVTDVSGLVDTLTHTEEDLNEELSLLEGCEPTILSRDETDCFACDIRESLSTIPGIKARYNNLKRQLLESQAVEIVELDYGTPESNSLKTQESFNKIYQDCLILRDAVIQAQAEISTLKKQLAEKENELQGASGFNSMMAAKQVANQETIEELRNTITSLEDQLFAEKKPFNQPITLHAECQNMRNNQENIHPNPNSPIKGGRPKTLFGGSPTPFKQANLKTR